ncbi:MAG: HD domain-containing protein, partial [Bacteroidia bacterium]|nr:HD domain-containing protein [Bacteroidia bacterium]
MINTSGIISTEEKYKLILENFFNSHFDKDFLVSHGLDHHRRVWNNAKELLQYFKYQFDQLFLQKLLIACYLHDIGMSVDTGIKHGQHSRELCILFLKEHHLEETDYKDVLSAIENHDNKDYDNSIVTDQLQTILSVADDLDAFGETGISRYLEIYLERGIDKQLIATAIRENARKRFDNFEMTFGNNPELLKKHRERYLVLDNYFKNNYL